MGVCHASLNRLNYSDVAFIWACCKLLQFQRCTERLASPDASHTHSLAVKNVESSAKCNFLSQRTQCCAKQKIRHTQEHIYLRLLRSFVSWYARILAYSIPLLCVYFCVENRVEWHHSFRLESSGWWLNWLAKQFSKYTFVVLWHWLPTG